jgi:hypothetical protein
MTDIELIDKLIKSKKPSDIFLDDWKTQYLQYCKLIHPDRNSSSLAAEAMAKMNYYKDVLENGTKYTDEAGEFRVFEKKIVYAVNDTNRKLIAKSVSNYNILNAKHDKASEGFKRYMPEKMILETDKLTIILNNRALPLTGRKLPQIHVNWLFSRMFEYVSWLAQINYSHLGLNPTTVFVVPETHGIQVVSFYHMTPVNKKVDTISAKYKMWYPTTLFSKKIATYDIDLELVKKIALYLLGDRSGAGTKLKVDKEVNQEILTFLLTKHQNEYQDYVNYRTLLKKNFVNKFNALDL